MKTTFIITLMLIILAIISGYAHEKDIISQIKETGKCTTTCWTHNIIIGEVISK